MLRLVQKMVWADSDGHAHPDKEGSPVLTDMNLREIVTLSFLLFFVFWIGLNPKPVLNVMDTSVAHLVEHVEKAKQHSIQNDKHNGHDKHDGQEAHGTQEQHGNLFELEKGKTRLLVLK
jgi:NADH-quinone oxidoreductase subunit M